MGAAFKIVEGRLFTYREQSEGESWKADHKWAILCFDYQELAREGSRLYDSITELDEDWRISVHRQALDYDSEIASRIDNLFREWCRTSHKILGMFVDRLENEYVNRGFDVTAIEDLRFRVREVDGCLTSDNDFFARDATFDMASAAIQEFREGKALEW